VIINEERYGWWARKSDNRRGEVRLRYGWWARKSDNRRGEVRLVGEKE